MKHKFLLDLKKVNEKMATVRMQLRFNLTNVVRCSRLRL